MIRPRLLDITADPARSTAWFEQGKCRDEDPEIFFHDPTAAKAICFDCPVQHACLDYALATRQAHGVWGGLDEDERRQLQDRQRRRKPIDHGTEAGYYRHIKRREKACESCVEASARARADRKTLP